MNKLLWCVTGVCLCLCLSSAAQGNAVVTVAPGYDLFRADPLNTVFGSFTSFAPFKGVPLGSFNFGGTVQNTGTTDTIIKRTAPGTPGALPGTAIVPIQMVALQLQSVQPFNFNGNGVDNYFVTLQSVHAGQIPSGTRNISFDASGNPTTFFDTFSTFAFDIRKGSLTGTIVFSEDFGAGTATLPPIWGRTPPTGALAINGVNRFLAGGSDPSQDFWSPSGEFLTDADPFQLQLLNAAVVPVPLPASVWSGLALLGLLGMLTVLQRRRAA